MVNDPSDSSRKFGNSDVERLRALSGEGPLRPRGENRLLSRLDAASRDLLKPHLNYCLLPARSVLEREGEANPFIYFPTSGAVSVVVGLGDKALQVDLVGREGFVGTSSVLGGTSTHTSVVLFAGGAWRMAVEALDECWPKSWELQGRLLAEVDLLTKRLTWLAFAQCYATIRERVAGWLLSAQSCLGQDDLDITHDELARLLGVQRVSVTVALHALQRLKSIRNQRRAQVSIVDRERLAEIAGTYGPRSRPDGEFTLRRQDR